MPSGPRNGGRRHSPAPASGSAFPSSNTHLRCYLLCTPPRLSPAEGGVRRAPLCLRLTTFQHTATLPPPPPTRPYRVLRPAKQAAPPQFEIGAVGLSQQVATPAGRAVAPNDSSQRLDALTSPDVPSGWTPPPPSPPVQLEYLSEEGPSTPEVFSSSSSWESEPNNSGGHYRRAATGPRCGPTRSPPPHAVPRTRAPRARSVHR